MIIEWNKLSGYYVWSGIYIGCALRVIYVLLRHMDRYKHNLGTFSLGSLFIYIYIYISWECYTDSLSLLAVRCLECTFHNMAIDLSLFSFYNVL